MTCYPPEGLLPLLKYPGGKRTLLPFYSAYLPADLHTRRFVEPMCGGMAASLVWASKFESVHVCDANVALMQCYQGLIHGDALDRIEFEAARYNASTNKEGVFYTWRMHVNDDPAAFWLVNRTTFNGLVRYNSSGGFNSPWGKVKHISQEMLSRLRETVELLRTAASPQSAVLRGAFTLHPPVGVQEFCTSFAWREGDIAFFDPPYHGGFTAYTPGGFGLEDQAALAVEVARLGEVLGVQCFVSNADHPAIRKLYEGVLTPVEVDAAKMISRKAQTRGKKTELFLVPAEASKSHWI